ncbi:hypothetical protein PoB_005612800 [Plakobranchus ocellatus]|uniref:Uncharacterized protein n=1 Tax=Plakobranchus ocellatus TaxID=259542 RepID=A0AAV4CF67_9GAST|nr:hypothetical protein PoB_005612800 [Plakobranchus ocellatus]
MIHKDDGEKDDNRGEFDGEKEEEDDDDDGGDDDDDERNSLISPHEYKHSLQRSCLHPIDYQGNVTLRDNSVSIMFKVYTKLHLK